MQSQRIHNFATIYYDQYNHGDSDDLLNLYIAIHKLINGKTETITVFKITAHFDIRTGMWQDDVSPRTHFFIWCLACGNFSTITYLKNLFTLSALQGRLRQIRTSWTSSTELHFISFVLVTLLSWILLTSFSSLLVSGGEIRKVVLLASFAHINILGHYYYRSSTNLCQYKMANFGDF